VYIRFDLSGPDSIDTWILEDLIREWAQDRGIRFTKKIIWNHRRREYRVSFLAPQDYTLFALTWPDWAPIFEIVKNRQDV